MFERFTERARQVVVLAQGEARDLQHDYIGTEHILVGLLREEEGVAAQVLESLGITAEDVRARVESIVGRGREVTSGQIPFTPRAKKVLELSLREAIALGHDHIGTEHILLGLAREKDGVAMTVLLELDLDGGRIRSEVLRQLTSGQRLRRQARTMRASPPHQAWEHRIERVANEDELSAESLDALGAEGWELTAVTPAGEGLALVFKRQCLPPG